MVNSKHKNNDDLMFYTQVHRFLKVKEVAVLLKVCVKTIHRWDVAGKIICYRTPGGHRRIPMSEVIRLQNWKHISSTKSENDFQKDIMSRNQNVYSLEKDEPDSIEEDPLSFVEQNSLLRHDMNALKNQLKLLRYLLINSFNSEANLFVFTELITIMRAVSYTHLTLPTNREV